MPSHLQDTVLGGEIPASRLQIIAGSTMNIEDFSFFVDEGAHGSVILHDDSLHYLSVPGSADGCGVFYGRCRDSAIGDRGSIMMKDRFSA